MNIDAVNVEIGRKLCYYNNLQKQHPMMSTGLPIAERVG
jgi:hypothetical protein